MQTVADSVIDKRDKSELSRSNNIIKKQAKGKEPETGKSALRAKLSASGLYRAAEEGNVDLVIELLDKGADPNAYHKRAGATALHCAAAKGHEDCLRALLIRGGAHVDSMDREQGTPLY